MSTKAHQARAFALAVATIRSDAETLDDAPLYCDMEDRKTYRYVDHLPRKEYRLPTPGNPRGMIVSAPAARDSLNALADRLEKGARAFGGQPPKRDRSPLNTRGIVAARNAHAEGHRNAAHRALDARLFIAASGAPFAVVSQMQAAGHGVLLCRSIAARSNTVIAFCARSGVRLATAGSASAPADFNDFCAWIDSTAADYSGKLESMASLDQGAAVAAYLEGDTVETVDPDAEPCDTAAAIARAEASTAPEPEPEPEPEQSTPRQQLGRGDGQRDPGTLYGWHIVTDADGVRYMVLHSRHHTVVAVPLVEGRRPEVSRSGPDVVRFNLRPGDTLETGERAGPLFDTGKVYDLNTLSTKPEPERAPAPAPAPAPEPEPEPDPSPCDATDAPADPAETATPASADACKAGDTAGEKLASPQAVKTRALLFQPPARMVVPRGHIRAAKVKARMPGAPPADETQAASRSMPWAGETSRRRQSRRCTMRRREPLCLPHRRSRPLRTERRCARRRHVPPRKTRADDAPHYIAADTRPPPSLPAKRWILTAPGPSWQSWNPCRQKADRAAGES